MLASAGKATRSAARQVTLAALQEGAARPLANAVFAGTPEMRKGAAEILTQNLRLAPDRDYCADHLIRLFNDPDEDVRKETAEWTLTIPNQGRIGSLIPVADAFVVSPAFEYGADSFFRALEQAIDAPPSLVLRAGNRFIELSGSSVGDVRQSDAHVADELSGLIVRAYRQAEHDDVLRSQCLDLFDLLLEVGGYGADEAMDSAVR